MFAIDADVLKGVIYMKIVNVFKFVRAIFLIIIVLIFISLFLTNSITLSHTETQYKELYIGAGETLWSIAKVELKENPYYFNKDIREIISDIKHRNELNTSALYIGQKLLIPCM